MKPRFSLLARIYLSTAVAVTVLFAAAGWFFERQASAALHDGVEQEVRSSLGSVDALWQSRAEVLGTTSALFASMSDVRAAFGTRDRATIRDTAGELWSRAVAGHADAESAAFAVADPEGAVLASLGRQPLPPAVLDPARRNLQSQSSSFAISDKTIWQVIQTPVYVDSGKQAALLSVLIAAHPVTAETLGGLKTRTGGSDFLLRAGGQTILATMDTGAIQSHPEQFAIRPTYLQDASGKALAELWAVRSFAGVEARVASLRRSMIVAWLAAMSIGLILSYFLARRVVSPVQALNRAAQQVAREDYSARVNETSNDELGVLSSTFNRMAASIEKSRADQVRNGQIAAIGRLAASIAHDLRNPMAAILGGTEMLADFDLSPEQMKQTAQHVHQAAGRMDKLVSEIGRVARAKPGERAACPIGALIAAAIESQRFKAHRQNVSIRQSNPEGLIAVCEKSRIERVLMNLIANALEVLPDGGEIEITARKDGARLLIDVADTGPGIPPEILPQLFQPFVTSGKTNGLGLGLALARQAAIDSGGELELVPAARGACFRLALRSA